jgi:hypothetical protein
LTEKLREALNARRTLDEKLAANVLNLGDLLPDDL